MADTLKRLETAGLRQEFDEIMKEYVSDPSKKEDFLKEIDAHGLKSDPVMVFISTANRDGTLKPGVYRKFVELDMTLQRKESEAGTPTELPQADPPSAGADPEATPPEPPPAEAKPKEEKSKGKGKGKGKDKPTVKAKEKGEKPKKDPKPKAKAVKDKDGKTKFEPVAKPGEQVALEEVIRPSSMAYNVLKYFHDGPRTMEEAEAVASNGDAGFHAKRLKSTVSVFTRPTERWYLPRFGWSFQEVGEKDGNKQFQVVPLKK